MASLISDGLGTTFWPWSIFVMWLGCQFLNTQVDGSNPVSISMS